MVHLREGPREAAWKTELRDEMHTASPSASMPPPPPGPLFLFRACGDQQAASALTTCVLSGVRRGEGAGSSSTVELSRIVQGTRGFVDIFQV